MIFISYLESFKYVGHLWPVALIRLWVAAFYFQVVSSQIDKGLLSYPLLSEQLRLKTGGVDSLNNYVSACSELFQTQWEVFSYAIVILGGVASASYLIGYLVRPVALIMATVSLHMWLLFELHDSQLVLMMLHLLFCLLGAGRCLGVDYYFYKSRRGLLW